MFDLSRDRNVALSGLQRLRRRGKPHAPCDQRLPQPGVPGDEDPERRDGGHTGLFRGSRPGRKDGTTHRHQRSGHGQHGQLGHVC